MIAIFPEIAECVERKEFEKLACLIRSYFAKQDTYAPVLNLEEIYKDLGIPIREMPVEGIAALACKDQKGTFALAVIINKPQYTDPTERRFLLAHLLGYFFIHVQPHILSGDWDSRGILLDHLPSESYINDTSENTIEQNSNTLAAALLMPHGFILKAASRFNDTLKMAKFFGVTEKMLRKRLAELNLLDGLQPSQSRKPSKSHPKALEGAALKKSGMERIREIAQGLDKSS